MRSVVGIIPAGGRAERFRGMSKEMLPVADGDCALTRCIKTMLMGDASEIFLASRHDRIREHWRAVEPFHNVRLMAREFAGLWEFIAFVGERTNADRYLFAMPDTVYPIDVFLYRSKGDLACGTFHTNKTGRFGILAGNSIVDKSPDMVGNAWGVWMWSRDAMKFLTSAMRETRNHTSGFNRALARFGVDAFSMSYYYDFAAFDDYVEFLCNLT